MREEKKDKSYRKIDCDKMEDETRGNKWGDGNNERDEILRRIMRLDGKEDGVINPKILSLFLIFLPENLCLGVWRADTKRPNQVLANFTVKFGLL
jgi:hypothetical protein